MHCETSPTDANRWGIDKDSAHTFCHAKWVKHSLLTYGPTARWRNRMVRFDDVVSSYSMQSKNQQCRNGPLLDLFQDLCIANKRLILSDWCSLIEIVFNLMRFNKDQSQKAKRAANTSFISLLVISIQPTPKPSATDRNKSKCLFCCSLFVDNDAFPVATMMLCLFADDHDASPFLSIVAMLLKTWAHILVLSVIGIL